MAAKTGLTVIKRFTYRGDATEEWSNTYWFSGSVPADDAAWLTLFTALATQEKTLYTSGTSIVRAYGYNDDTGHYGEPPRPNPAPAVWVRDLTIAPNTPIPGTYTSSGGVAFPGDAAAWVRWKTSRLSEKGKAIYLRKYYHDVEHNYTVGPDSLKPAQVSAYAAFGTKLRDGSFADSRTLTAAGHSDTLVGSGVAPYVTTRTLKRRGKRPGS